MGSGFKASISHTTSVAIVNLYADGSCSVYCNTVDMGQGSDTAMAQIAAEELDVSLARVRMVSGDTALTPDEGHTSGSRSIDEGGSAMRYACAEARHLLLQERLGMLILGKDRRSRQVGHHGTRERRSFSSLYRPGYRVLERNQTGNTRANTAFRYSVSGMAG